MKSRLAILLTAASLALAGCQSVKQEDVGTVVGGALGGVLGSQIGDGSGQTAATIAGTLVGAYLGRSVGRSMDDTDRLKAHSALETTPTGHSRSWRNPDTGARYEVTPTRTYSTASGPCREFNTEAWIGGEKEDLTGTACRQSDGSWLAM